MFGRWTFFDALTVRTLVEKEIKSDFVALFFYVCRLQIKGKQAFVFIDFTYGSIDLLFAIMCDFPGRQLRKDIDPFIIRFSREPPFRVTRSMFWCLIDDFFS